MRVIVTEYQPAWVEQFEEEAQALKQILKENCLKVEHIGSTSVPNLAAKPIIDFLVIVEEIEKVDLLQGNLKESVMNIWGNLDYQDVVIYEKAR